jgi:6-pyruvoyl-tetrahydropterin synthase
MIEKIEVFVEMEFHGFHQWPQAPAEVSHLRDMHHHLFGVKVVCEVKHDNRDVEFLILLSVVQKYIWEEIAPKMKQSSMSTWSCEMMARMIRDHLLTKEYKPSRVEVSEEWLNGAVLTTEF